MASGSGHRRPVAVYLQRQGRLPTFFELFEVYGGPWSSRLEHWTFVWLLLGFLAVAGLG
jgi:hypothetical protein